MKEMNDKLLKQVLARLDIDYLPNPDLHGLKLIYSAWCRKVPFDNVRKLIHLRAQNPSPLPGHEPQDFFSGWLRYGTGGTCWAGSGAFHLLLSFLGFKVFRGVATMLIAPDLPPNHGTVMVDIGGIYYLVDTSMLHGSPMEMKTGELSRIEHPAWGVSAEYTDFQYHIRWRPLHMLNGCDCRIDKLGGALQTFRDFNEETRRWGPFNYSLYARINRGDSVVGVAYGQRVTIDSTGAISTRRIDAAGRRRFLTRVLGIEESLVRLLPPDESTPPPPAV